jgi:4-amino-4-deoxy-L-arabinose transferase-like glycosyltransferase
MILALLPFLCWSLVALTFNKRGLGWRMSFLSASVVCGVTLTTATEILSVFRQIHSVSLFLFWGLAVVASALIFVSTHGKEERPRIPVSAPAFLKLLLAGVVAIAVVTALVATVSAPNNWDSMTYHLSRVMHWGQNQSVADYPTNIVEQIESNPWAEFAVLHLQVLGGGDFFVNFVQWFSMVGSVIGVTLIAAEFGADFRTQVYSSVVVATVPMGILQSSSTQNDYVVSFWLVCFVYFGILFSKRSSWYCALAAGASLGLAILTKGTAYIYAFPFLIWFLLSSFRLSCGKALRYVLLMLLVVISLNASHYMRNYTLFGNPLSSGKTPRANLMFNGSTLFSNVLRNTALDMGTPWETINDQMQAGFEEIFKVLHININDPKTTRVPFEIVGSSLHEDKAGNPLHFILILLSIVLIAARRDIRKSPNLLPYFLAVNMAFLSFCLYLRWLPWHSRLHLPLFVLWGPVIAVALSRIKSRFPVEAVMTVMLIFSIPYLFYNESRPLLGCDSIMTASRLDQYFRNRKALKKSYYDSAALVAAARCDAIGLQLKGNDDWEYPFWMIMKGMTDQQLRIEHIGVSNASERLATGDFSPCAVINTGKDGRVYASFHSIPSGDIVFGDIPAFKIEGFGVAEGPYSQWLLPKVRWMNRPVGKIEIEGIHSQTIGKLVMSFRPQVRARANMELLLNSRRMKCYNLEGAGKWMDDEIDMPLQPGTNVIELLSEPIPGQVPPPDSLYMLFRRLSFGAADN